jgi:hypothetical protein
MFPEPTNVGVARGPLPRQLEFLNAALANGPGSPKYIRYLGGIGCMSSDTLVKTSDGLVPITDLYKSKDVISSSFGQVSSLKSVPFPKGRDRLYRVQHEHGEFVAAGHHLVLCEDHKYRRVDSLESGACLFLQSSESPPETNLASDLLASPSSVEHWKQTLSGFLLNCLACYRQYGQLPPQVTDIAREMFPQLIGALGCNLSSEHKDDLLALEQGHIHPDQLYSLLSSLGYALLGEGLEQDVVGLVSSISSESPSDCTRGSPQSGSLSVLRHSIPELCHNQSVVLPYTKYIPSTVKSVNRKEEIEWYWDVQVPLFSNYVTADGSVHHNSGKTMIGCITMLTLAVMYEGDYLIGRQFYPELRDTTLKTFLELCPPELIIEHRVADAIVVLRNAKGTKSSILFRALEDPDKLRSLNLNAFYIDESCQASEAAFLLLQGRLRGRFVRKGFLTTNSDGRSWGWRYFVQKGMFKDEESKKLFLDIRAPSTENVHLPDGYVDTMLKTWSQERIDREINADEDSFEGAVYSEFRRDTHVIKPFRIPDDWKRVVGADHGFRNPAAFIWGAIDYDGNIYLYKEYYEKEKLIEEICKDVVRLNGDDAIEGIWIDPSIKATRGQTGLSDWHTYCEHLPKKFALYSANNDVAPGIDRVKSYLKINEKTKRPSLYIFDTLTHLLDEIGEYRWDPMSEVRSNSNNFKEQPRKYKDHACFRAGTLVSVPGGQVPIEQLRPGDLVLTSLGAMPIANCGITGIKSVYRFDLLSTYLESTEDHPILLQNGTTKLVRDLTYSDISSNLVVCPNKLNLIASYIGKLALTTDLVELSVRKAVKAYTEKCGNFIMDLSQKVITSTTSITIPITMTLATWDVFQPKNTLKCTLTTQMRGLGPQKDVSTPSTFDLLQRNGTPLLKGLNGIGNTLSALLRKTTHLKTLLSSASSALKSLKPTLSQPQGQSSATQTAKPGLFVGVEPVYNLSVHGVSEYYANGILVSNCDAARYLVMSRPDAPKVDKMSAFKNSWETPTTRIAQEMQRIKNPEPKDPFQDF